MNELEKVRARLLAYFESEDRDEPLKQLCARMECNYVTLYRFAYGLTKHPKLPLYDRLVKEFIDGGT